MGRQKITGVTVLGDFVRPDHDGYCGGVDRQIAWLYNAVRHQISAASGLPVTLCTVSTEPAIADLIAAARPNHHALAYWAGHYAALSMSLAEALTTRLAHQFCVGYETPPYLVALLRAAEIPHIDLRIHPVRFLDDLLLAVRASDPQTHTALFASAVDESLVIATAGLREATLQYLPHASLAADTLLVVGQRGHDSSQIVDGRFFSAATHLDEIESICTRYGAVMLKSHPLEAYHSLLVAARATSPGVQATTENIYKLLSRPEITSVLTVNSSVAFEAPYFGKRVHTLAPAAVRLGWRGSDADSGTHASVDDRVLTVDFWRLVLAPHVPTTAMDGVLLPAKPNRMRVAMGSFWDFQAVETDLVPASASAVA